MNENLDLVKILKNCPKGTPLYSPVLGKVKFEYISICKPYPILVTAKENEFGHSNGLIGFTKDGRFLYNYDGECSLFPSKDQQDWSKFKVRVEKFDYSTLKPFDQVIVRNNDHDKWRAAHYSYMDYYPDTNHKNMMCDIHWEQGIPYNDETKHLVGTSDMPNEKYIWWKD